MNEQQRSDHTAPVHPERSGGGRAGGAQAKKLQYPSFSETAEATNRPLFVNKTKQQESEASSPSRSATSGRQSAPLRRTLLVGLISLALAATPTFAGAGASPERKQKELEEAVAKAADSPSADLTRLQCGNLVYAGNKSSICFADKFLTDVARETNLKVGKNFVPVKLDADQVFDFPFCVWSGEEDFQLTKKERENLRKYLLNGGFILSSPGCSDAKWDHAVRREMKLVFPEHKLVPLPMSHPVFSTVNQISRLTDKKGAQTFIEGMEVNGRLVMVYTKDGLNDVANAKGCCCCGGNQIRQSEQVNVNILLYALLH